MNQTYDGATTALHRRIEESDRRIDELAVIRARLERRIEELTADLATARAARESAEKLKELAYARTEEAARERDTALAALEGANSDCERYGDNWMRVVKRANAAEARVKELEADKAVIIEARDQAGIGWATAETALASARGKLARVEALMSGNSVSVGALVRALEDDTPAPVAMCRTDVGGVPCGEQEPCAEHPHPAPVAAPSWEHSTQEDIGPPLKQSPLDKLFGAVPDMPLDAPVAAVPCAGCEKLTLHVSMLEGEFETCHRQHEQCMKLLTRAMPHLVGLPVYDLIDEMLERGERPATPCSQCEATKKKLLEALRRLGDSGDYISFRARITEAAR